MRPFLSKKKLYTWISLKHCIYGIYSSNLRWHLNLNLKTSSHRFREVTVLYILPADDKLGVNCEQNIDKIVFVSV
jgi:hypothetical protein